jgi:hypothetical protein
VAGSLGRMSRAIGQTANLCEHLQVDLHTMRVFVDIGSHKGCTRLYRFMTVAVQLNSEEDEKDLSNRKPT